MGSDLLILCPQEPWEDWDWFLYLLFSPLAPNLAPFPRLVTCQMFWEFVPHSKVNDADGSESIWCFFFVFFSQFTGRVVSLIVFFSPWTHISILAALSSCFLGLNISVRLHWHSSGQGTYFPLHLNFSGHYQKAFGTAVILSICFIDKFVIPWSSPSHTYAVIPAVSRAFGIKKLTAGVTGVTIFLSAGA